MLSTKNKKLVPLVMPLLILAALPSILGHGSNKVDPVRTNSDASNSKTTDLATISPKFDPSNPRSILNFVDLTQKEDTGAYWQIANQIAVASDYLDVTGCRPEPIVFKVKLGSTFKIINNDAISHTIVDGPYNFTVPAKGSTSFIADFGQGAGLYAYSCDDDDIKSPVAVMLITN